MIDIHTESDWSFSSNPHTQSSNGTYQYDDSNDNAKLLDVWFASLFALFSMSESHLYLSEAVTPIGLSTSPVSVLRTPYSEPIFGGVGEV